MNTNAIGKRLRAARERAGFVTGSAFAKAMGIRPEQVSRYERGARQAGLEVLRKAAKLCNTSIDWLVSGRGKAPPRKGDGLANNEAA
jgi:transcriptional regulator with XRE-family HTH domain